MSLFCPIGHFRQVSQDTLRVSSSSAFLLPSTDVELQQFLVNCPDCETLDFYAQRNQDGYNLLVQTLINMTTNNTIKSLGEVDNGFEKVAFLLEKKTQKNGRNL